MSSAFIREGDTTSHGGRVLACTSTNIVFGKPLALEGDMVSCPKCGGVYPIIGVRVRSMTFGGRAVATDGDKTACGATLIASQGQATVEPTSGAGGSIGAGKSVLAQNVAQDDGAYRGRFQLVDDRTREPIANHPYTVTSADGKTVQGTTDASGHTDWLSSHQASSLSFQQPGSSE
ncbi:MULTISPECIES: PAAR domain-containing protein [Burkholderia cepacia complex]|uniref:PAAR domain-containing protein n=1 Tax=Burkholderia cepacia complex TaxID=87882 RepID=UPI0019040136|nr:MULTISPECIES: PAAR domain-containing protein [Burkholderia cepacia complex]MBJ9727554.1 PAAR domain-containing protein [Burkholderia cenocepacia]MDN7533643.1 PAAR domain-containing protein [Burkholderia orbicola]